MTTDEKITQKNSLFTIPQPPSFTKNDNQRETFIILGKHAVYLQSPRLCSSRKYPYTPTKDKGNSEEGGRGSKRRRYPRGRRWHRLKYSASAFLTEIFFPGDIQPSGKIMKIPGVMGYDKYNGLGRRNKSAFGGYGYFLEKSISPCEIKKTAFWKTCSHLTIARQNRARRTV